MSQAVASITDNYNSLGARPWTVAMGYLAVGVASGYLLAQGQFGAAAKRAFDIRANASEWVEVREKSPVFTLEPQPFGLPPQRLSSFVHPDGGRSDWTSFGTLGDMAPNATIQIVRRTEPLGTRNSLAQNLQEMHEVKVNQRRFGNAYYVLSTRLGELRAVSFVVRADGVQKACLGFHRAGTSKLFIRGFVCSPDRSQVEPNFVACLLDNIRFTRPADEESAKTALGGGEAKPCGAVLLSLDPDNTVPRSADRTL
jgi:hypothetical protein